MAEDVKSSLSLSEQGDGIGKAGFIALTAHSTLG